MSGLTRGAEAAERLPTQVGAVLQTSAREAFTDGLNVAGGLGAVLFVAMADVAFTVLRNIGGPREEPLGQATDTTGPERDAVLAEC